MLVHSPIKMALVDGNQGVPIPASEVFGLTISASLPALSKVCSVVSLLLLLFNYIKIYI